MPKFAVTLIAATMLALPAMAQTAAPSTPGASNTPMTTEQAQAKIKQDLTSDGYTDVSVAPNSFLVHAKNKRNENVVMIINPDSVFAVTQLPQDGQQPQGQTGTTKQ